MNSKVAKIMAIASIFIMVFSATAVIDDTNADDNKTMTVTDGLGNTHVFNELPAHVITIGKGFTEMMCQLNALDKLILTDEAPYSSTDGISIFNDYKARCLDGQIRHSGSVYTSGWTSLKFEIIDAADNGRFDRNTDALILTGGHTYTDKIYAELTSDGFKHVLRWEEISSYIDIITAAETVSNITKGYVDDKVKLMKTKSVDIYNMFEWHPEWKAKKVFYVTFSGGQFKVGNYGSIATSVLLAAYADVVTLDKGRSETTYAPEGGITSLVEKYEGDVVIFADQDTIMKNEERYNRLVHESGGAKIYQMNSLWNNYSIDSMNGYWTAACTLYNEYDPDFFSGSIADEKSISNHNIWFYFLAGIVISVILIGITYWVSRE